MPREVRAYKCEYCDKVYINKPSAASHEKKCFWNPEKRACATCLNPYDRRCVETDSDLTVKGELKSNCPMWEASEEYQEDDS